MKKYLILFRVLLAFALFSSTFFLSSTASAQDDPLFSHIAPDASAVYRINMAQIASKVNWTDIQSHLPAPKAGSKDKELMDLIKDPLQSGIDVKANVLVTTSVKDLIDSVNSTTIVVRLTDSTKFRIFLRKQFHGLRINRYADRSYSTYTNKMGIVWNKDFAVLVMVSASVKDVVATAMAHANPDGKMNSQAPKPRPENYEAIAVSTAIHALKGWPANPIADDPDFKAAFSNDADMQSFTRKMGFSKYMKGIRKMLPDSVFHGLNLDSLSSNRNSSMALWFGNGKITLKSTSTLQPNIAEFMERTAPPDLNPDLLARVPKGNLLALASLRINLSWITFTLDRLGIKDKLNAGLAKKGMSLDDFGRAFKGDLLFALKEPDHIDSSQKFVKPKPELYFVTSINDMASLSKLGVALSGAKDSVSKPGMMGGDSIKKATFLGNLKNRFAIKDNILVFSMDKGMAEAYFANTDRRHEDMLTTELKESPVFVWIDLHELVNFLVGPVRSDDGGNPQIKMMNSFHLLDKLVMKSQNMHNGKVSAEFELSTTKTDQNILQTILEMVPAPKH